MTSQIWCPLFACLILQIFGFVSRAEKFNVMVQAQAVNAAISTNVDMDFEPQCIEILNKTLEPLGTYLGTHASSNTEQSERAFQAYHKQLMSVGPNCFSQVFEYVSITSALYSYWGQDSDIVHNMIRLLSYAQRRHWIHPMTDEVQKRHPELADKNPLGIYSCEEIKIWLNPNLRPFNLGTALLHELEHLARNMALTSLYSSEGFPKNLFTPTSYHLFDEAMSSLNAGIKQVQIRSNSNRDKAKQVKRWNPLGLGGGLLIYWKGYKKYFQAENDLNLYHPQGQLVGLWVEQIRKKGVPLDASYLDILQSHFFIPNSMNPKTEGIFHLVQDVYLPTIPYLGFDAYSIAERILNGPLKHLSPLIDPMAWIQTLDESQRDTLLESRMCRLNNNGNGGAEGVGLLLTDEEMKLMNSGVRACLWPAGEM